MSSLFDLGWRAALNYAGTGPFLLFALITVAKATMILFVVQLLCFVLRRYPASVRHLILSSAMGLLLFLPFAWWAPALYGVDFASPLMLATGETLVLDGRAQEALPALGQAVVGPTLARTLFTVAALTIGLAWAAGAAVFLSRLLLGLFRVRFLIRESLPVRAPAMAEALKKASQEIGLTRPVRLLETELLPSPASWGVTRPVVLLPGDAVEWDPRRLRLVLVHELAHIRRIDTITQILVQTCSALYWFHPLVWTTATQIRREREVACDDVVLNRGCEPEDYADHLLQMARRVKSGGAPWGLAAAMAQRSYLEDRLLALLSPTTNRTPLSGRSKAMTALVMSMVMLLAVSVGVPAGQGKAVLTGVVTDVKNAPVEGARVLAATADGNRQDVVHTGPDGKYIFDGLQEGLYNLEVSARYFKRVLLPEVVLRAGETTSHNVQLEVGQIVEEMQITSETQAAASSETAPGAGPERQPKPPKLLHRVNPAYPPEARQEGATGWVVLRTVVGEDGVPKEVTVVSQIVDERLAKAAVEAVKQWTYEPMTLEGEPVPFETTLTVRFRLE